MDNIEIILNKYTKTQQIEDLKDNSWKLEKKKIFQVLEANIPTTHQGLIQYEFFSFFNSKTLFK